MARSRPPEPLAKTYAALTALFIVSVIVAIGSVVTLAGLVAYSYVPGVSDRSPSRGIVQSHPTVVLVVAISVGLSVVCGITLAILDHVLDR